jgi:hypothetical protein
LSNLRSEQFGSVIRAQDLSTPDARRSREVTPDEFHQIASRGAQKYEAMKAASQEPKGLDRNWDSVVATAHEASREPWGGVTVNPRSGKPISTSGNKYAITAREPGMDTVSVEPSAPPEEFRGAMGEARQRYGEILSRKNHHLGVFHDADKGAIDIDPVVIVNNRKDVEEIGAHTRAVGGAYHFKSGNGFWPPHVRD